MAENYTGMTQQAREVLTLQTEALAGYL